MKALLVVLSLAAGAAWGQGYPAKPITILNGFPPGGATDLTLRQTSAKLAERLGQPVVIENRGGAAGTIAAAAVARAAPDGYTLLFGVAANLAVAPATMKNPPYDPAKAFAPIIEVARGPYLWMVRSDVPARNVREFIDWAKKNGGKVNYGSPGQGSVHHLATEMFKRAAGLDMVHVPYKGGSGSYAALLGGEIDAMFDTMPAPIAHLQSGKIRAIGVTGATRLQVMPEVATLAEQGVAGVDAHFWWGFVGPAGLPREIVGRLNAEFARVLADPELKATFAKWNIEASPGTPEAFGAYIAQESRRWRETVAAVGLNLE